MAPTIRGDLVGSVHVTDELGRRVVLTAGQPVPDGYTVGDHVLEPGSAVQGGSGGGEGGGSGGGPDLSGNIGAVLERVGDDPAAAKAYLEAEQARGDDARKGLVEQLEKLAAQ